MKIGNIEFNLTTPHTYVMGILNVTPDSFSDGGSFCNLDIALTHVQQMIDEGADIIDVGGESTRPGYIKVPIEEEIERVCDVISVIKDHVDIPISIDTYKVKVAEAAIKAGADMVNDIWGLRFDADEGVTDMARLVAESNVPVILMHNDDYSRNLSERVAPKYSEEEVLQRVLNGLGLSVDMAKRAGVRDDRIILDPGIGFAKTQRENMLMLRDLKKLVDASSYPVLLAASRKSVIGNVLDLPVNQREEGTIATSVLAAETGCSFVRVHDVEKNVRAIRMYEAIRNIR